MQRMERHRPTGPPCCDAAPALSEGHSSMLDTAEEVALPTLLPLMDACHFDDEPDSSSTEAAVLPPSEDHGRPLDPDACQSDSESVGGHLRKARRVSSPGPAPTRGQALGLPAELATALDARGCAYVPRGPSTTYDFCRAVIAEERTEDNFYVYDLSVVERLYRGWTHLLPRVTPYYAVKCNPNDGILAVLAALGAGFDCASQAEISQVLALGVPLDRIIYAHPQKPPRELRWAAAHGVGLTTFDTESELQKLAQWHPGCGLLLRIRADDPAARCQLGNKYGAEPGTVPALLREARRLGLRLRGVSFHVGSGASNPEAFTAAIQAARSVFDLAAAHGFGEMDTLDIGGGFSGGAFTGAGGVDMGGVPAAVNAALEAHFPAAASGGGGRGRVRVIAEPGRYFAEAAATLACFVNGWRERPAAASAVAAAPGPGTQGGGASAAPPPPARDYWLTDGLYGSMNCLLYDHATLAPCALHSPLLPAPEAECGDGGSGGSGGCSAALCPTTLFGPTCDGLDTIVRDVPMPKLRVGDWVLFPRFGAYTIAGAVNFNGFDVAGAAVHYIYSMP